MIRYLFRITLLASLFCCHASAEPQDSLEARFASGVQALQEEQLSAAIRDLEYWADRGQHHPDVSYNRGLAYLRRADSPARQAGDLGQAIAAFTETLSLTPQDQEATWGLEEARLQIARRRASRTGEAALNTEPLSARVLQSFSPALLFGLQVLGSLLLCVGLLCSFKKNAPALRITAWILSVGGLLIGGTSSLLQHLRDEQLLGARAVVIAERSTAFDASGRPLRGAPALFEGQLVQVREIQGGLARLVTEQEDLWVQRTSLRLLPQAGGPAPH